MYWIPKIYKDVHNLNNINEKSMSNLLQYMTLTLHTKLHHDKLKSKFPSIVDFVFNVGDKNFIRIFNNGAAKLGKKTKREIYFNKITL